ncbi:MAG: tetratricopeptide repeat protein [Pseudomonadota bacterium]
MLAEAYIPAGRIDEGLRLLAEALAFGSRTGEGFYLPEVHRTAGALHLSRGDVEQAVACLMKAIDAARQQQAKSLELRAARDLARLWAERGERQRARDLLAPVYGCFTEGFDTPDLKEAKVLLAEL